MNIGTLAKQANVNVQTVRYYERIGVLKTARRESSGYRTYDAEALERLLFVKRAQDLGFSLEDIKQLLELSISTPASRTKAREISKIKLAEIRLKIAQLKQFESQLKELVEECEHGASSSACPILNQMAGTEAAKGRKK